MNDIKYRITHKAEVLAQRLAHRLPARFKIMVIASAHAEWSMLNPTALCGTHVTLGQVMDALDGKPDVPAETTQAHWMRCDPAFDCAEGGDS